MEPVFNEAQKLAGVQFEGGGVVLTDASQINDLAELLTDIAEAIIDGVTVDTWLARKAA